MRVGCGGCLTRCWVLRDQAPLLLPVLYGLGWGLVFLVWSLFENCIVDASIFCVERVCVIVHARLLFLCCGLLCLW